MASEFAGDMFVTRRPDIVVGIDVGQTCSGVAYSIGPDWSDPRTLNRWPSKHGMEKADKVATRVGYSKTRREPKNWGFESVFGDIEIDVREQFKLTLDPDWTDYRGFNCQDARRWYYDYLTFLHREIETFFDASIPRWRNLHVEYNFSTPTTWKNPAMIASIEKLVKSAGFASTAQQSVRMTLTEAEAAAIEASKTAYREGDVLLICDAGGGTTDVNLLKVKSVGRWTGLEPLDQVEGVSVGSTLIDFRIAEHIAGRLDLIKDHLEGEVDRLADEMLTGQFQTVKHSFPNPIVEEFSLDVRGLAGSHTFPEAGIINSRMVIERATLKDIFDQQLNQIFGLIDERLLDLQARSPNEQVSYVILSGGLGGSPYVYEEIKRRYEMNFGFRSNNAASIRIMQILEPQLAVVRGIVRERTQQLGSDFAVGKDVFETRRCRNSYGVVVRVPYNESKHRGLPVIKDELNNRLWVSNIVDWFIRVGEEISTSEGIARMYTATLAENDHQHPRQATIVMSSLPAEKLPQMSTDPGCKKVVSVTYRLTGNDMKLKNRKFWELKRKYWKAEFSFMVRIGPADLKFEIRGKNGVLSTGHDDLKAEFADPSETKKERTCFLSNHESANIMPNMTG